MAEERVCARPGCGERFVAERSTAKYHSATCRQRAARDRKAAEHNAAEDAKAGKDEHDLVKAVREALTKAGVLMTVNGQLALQLARRAANPEESGLVALSKELDARMSAALGPHKSGGAGADSDGHAEGEGPEEDDEVTKARRQREDARKAAGLA